MQANEKKIAVVDAAVVVNERFIKSLPTYARKGYHFIDPSVKTLKRRWPKVGRNELCPCGSGKKYKRCHIGKDLSRFIKST